MSFKKDMFSVISWNVNSIRARWLLLEQLLKQEKPDVVLLQETKIEDKIFPEESLGDFGYNVCFYGQKSYNGVAILSRHPLESIQRGFLGSSEEARYIEAETQGIRIASLYAPNGQDVGMPMYARKLDFYEQLRAHLSSTLSSCDVFVIGGDYNVAPTDEDVYDPQKWEGHVPCTDAERAAFTALLADGFADAFAVWPSLQASAPHFTWWDYRFRFFDPKKGLRIDHFLLSPCALEQSQGGEVLLAYRTLPRPSDHAPIRWMLR
ncbi:MAG: exodeoxyribonuclease III [Holosporales bacterium]|jgi:exodeoxyribonuclease-3|nr:exodeoxyribonuclease III [Holosporales bacterium]